MIGAWSINVSGRLYGPFTSERMRSFASEGRLAPTSLVTREGTSDWHEARDEPEFIDLFTALPKEPVATFGKSQAKPASSTGAEAEGSKSHFAVVIDQKSSSTGNLDQAIGSFGPAYRLMQNIWILSTDQTVNAVRNRLVQELGKNDSLFVIDASRGKAAWFNFGPEADVRIRRVWQRT
jgi:GYF domain 2